MGKDNDCGSIDPSWDATGDHCVIFCRIFGAREEERGSIVYSRKKYLLKNRKIKEKEEEESRKRRVTIVGVMPFCKQARERNCRSLSIRLSAVRERQSVGRYCQDAQ